MTAAYLAVRFLFALESPWLLRSRSESGPDDAAVALRRELDALSAEKDVDKAKDDEVRWLIRRERYEDARRLVLHYHRDTLIDVVFAALSARYAPRRHQKRKLSFGSAAEWEEYLDDYLALDELADLFQKCIEDTERVVAVIARDIRSRIKNATDEYDVYDCALAVHCLSGSQYSAFLGEQAGEKGLNRYSLMEARRALAVLRKACKEAPEKYPHISRYTAVRWLCYSFATGAETNVDRAAHRIRELNRMLERLPDATRRAALRVMDGRRHEAADDVARQAPMLADCGAFYLLLATLPGDLRGFARMLMDGSRHADIAARFGVSKDEVAAYRAAIQRLLAALRPGTGRGERGAGR